ncbi:putative intermediate compartment protein [Entamoeba marina]
MNPLVENLIKCIFIGDPGCGKSSFIEMIMNNKILKEINNFYPEPLRKKNVFVDRTPYQLLLWDTFGQERYGVLSSIYYRNVEICILVYDITNRQSFEHIEKWLNDSRINIKPQQQLPNYILIGNKCDLVNERKVSYEEAYKYAEEHEFSFLETSVHQQINISPLFFNPLFDFLVNTNKKSNIRIKEKTETNKRLNKQKSFCSIS